MVGALANRLAVVTGGDRGIGRAVAVRLAQHGASILVNYRKREDEASATREQISGSGGKCTLFQGDMKNPVDVDRMFRRIDELGGAQILVNNAGLGLASPIANTDTQMFEKQVYTNFGSVFFCTRQFLMRPVGWGRIINISSIAARTPVPHLSVYGAAKSAVEAFTKYAACEAPTAVTVNCIAAGVVDTEMGNSLLNYLEANKQVFSGSLARPISPGDIAGLVDFLCGPDSDKITGQTFVVDAGDSVLHSWDHMLHRKTGRGRKSP